MSRHGLAKYLKTPEIDSLELRLQWQAVNRRVRRRRQLRAVGVASASLLVASLIVVYGMHTPSETVRPGQSAQAESESKTIHLAEGSELVLSPRSSVQLAEANDEEVVIVLEHGRGEFEVAKRPRRRFVVRAGAVEVRVVGTKFTVLHDGPHVEVLVLRGIVEVREGNAVTRLERGERWSKLPEAESAVAQPSDESDAKASVGPGDMSLSFETGDVAVPSEAPINVRAPSPDDTVPAPMSHRIKHRQPPQIDRAAAAQGGAALSTHPEDSAHANDTKPGDAFAAAMNARTNGRSREALAAFQLISERWPSSAFAPMSAFEWGRLALESEQDPQQAARAFERTLELATSASLIEDALARLTEAYARFDMNACRRRRAEYIRRFPEGPHMRGVTQACPH